MATSKRILVFATLYAIMSTVRTHNHEVTFIQDANVTSCLNNITANSSIAHEGLITFNFVDEKKTSVFQVPKCIFGNEIAKQLMRAVDLRETVESYRKRFYDFFIVPVHAAFRLINGHNLQYIPSADWIPQHDRIPTVTGQRINLTEVNDKLYVSATQATDMRFFNACSLFESHSVLFPLSTRCTSNVFQLKGARTASIVFTPKMFFIFIEETGSEMAITAFGNPRHLDVKAPYTRENFILRQTPKHDLLVIAKTKDVFNSYKYMTQTDFLEAPLRINYLNVDEILQVFDTLAMKTILSGSCHTINRDSHQMLFSYGLLVYTTYTARNASILIPVERAVQIQSNIMAAQRFVARCLNYSGASITFANAVEMINHTLIRTRTTGHALSPSSMTRAAYVLSTHDRAGVMNLAEFHTFTVQEAIKIHRLTMGASLTAGQRETLLFLNGIVHTTNRSLQDRRKVLVIQTGMCSPMELIDWAKRIYHNHNLTTRNIYTPCSSGSRRDYSVARLTDLFKLDFAAGLHTTTLRKIIDFYEEPKMSTFPHLECLNGNAQYTAITLPNATYIISDMYLLAGKTYQVTNTVVGRTIIITVPGTDRCIATHAKTDPHEIPMVKNITSTERCEFCESALIEYDEVGGVNNIIYLEDTQDLLYVTSDNSDMLVASSRTHYLMVTKNGTVMEVTDIVVDINQTSILLICVYVLFSIAALFGMTRVCKLF
ncbi:B75 [miniopterid betaherpesvirus 1]|uniref:B75 n=1 Tax=miniopterid betaherpesvirus 1 TaxID=3070189 RepID=I3VQ69_9BETA|nr:B75 [miniopterid betaherpesvirus 1]AFK83913.1 B75 [miniopterid betaherpesvirus 1]